MVAKSLKKFKFIALAHCVCDVLWINKFKVDFEKVLGEEVAERLFDVVIGKDNQACISNA